jgi:hypothetical protein
MMVLVLGGCSGGGSDEAAEPAPSTTSGATATTPDPSEPEVEVETEAETDAGSGGGCAVLSAATVSEILGMAYVEDPIPGAAPDGRIDDDGTTGYACTFSLANGGALDLVVTALDHVDGAYDASVETAEEFAADEGEAAGTAVDGVGTRAQVFRGQLGVDFYAEGTDGTLVTISLTTFNEDPVVEDQVAELAVAILGD